MDAHFYYKWQIHEALIGLTDVHPKGPFSLKSCIQTPKCTLSILPEVLESQPVQKGEERKDWARQEKQARVVG